jgi:hypothetical protein
MQKESGFSSHLTLRRSLVSVVFVASVLAAWEAAHAQTSAAPAKPTTQLSTVGVFSLLGDAIQVVASTDTPGATRIERSARDTLVAKNIGFDNIVLREVAAALEKSHPQAKLKMYRATKPMTMEEQSSIAIGAGRGELPAWMVQAVEADKLSHIVLVTPARGDTNIRIDENASIGRGTVQGIGFYIDTIYRMQNRTTGAISDGLLAPYVYVKLSLMDTQSAQVVGTFDVRDAQGLASRDQQPKSDPWTYLDNNGKVAVLREMLTDNIKRAMPELMKAR